MSGSTSKPTNRLKFQQIEKREQNDMYSNYRRKQYSSSKADVGGKFLYSYQQDFYKIQDKYDKFAQGEFNSNSYLKVDSNFKTGNSISCSKRKQPQLAPYKKPQSARKKYFFENEPAFEQIGKLDNKKLNINMGVDTKKQIIMSISECKKKFSQLRQPINYKNEQQQYIKQLKEIRNKLNQYDSSLAGQDVPLIEIIEKFVKNIQQNREKVKMLSDQNEKNRAEDFKKYEKQRINFRQQIEQTKNKLQQSTKKVKILQDQSEKQRKKLFDAEKQIQQLLFNEKLNKQLIKKCEQLEHENQNLLQQIQNKEKSNQKQEAYARQLFNQALKRGKEVDSEIQQVLRQANNSRAEFIQIQKRNQQVDRTILAMQQMVEQSKCNNNKIDTINKFCEQQIHEIAGNVDKQQKANADPNPNPNPDANQIQNTGNEQQNIEQNYQQNQPRHQSERNRQEQNYSQLSQSKYKKNYVKPAQTKEISLQTLRFMYYNQQVLDRTIRQLEANLGIEYLQDNQYDQYNSPIK